MVERIASSAIDVSETYEMSGDVCDIHVDQAEDLRVENRRLKAEISSCREHYDERLRREKTRIQELKAEILSCREHYGEKLRRKKTRIQELKTEVSTLSAEIQELKVEV